MARQNESQAPDAANEGPVGQGDYIVRQGDCIDSIADHFGHLPATIWNHPSNAELKSIRKNPNVLLPGDRLTVPKRRPKEEPGETELRHRFVLRGVPAKLKIRLLSRPDEEHENHEIEDDDLSCCGSYDDIPEDDEVPSDPDEVPEEPWADAPYELHVDGRYHEGSTDADGCLEVPIPPGAKSAFLRVGEPPHQREFDITLGGIDPIEALSGVQQRLNNLGFESGRSDGILGPVTRGALHRFQAREELDDTGEPDQATRQRLVERHGS